MIVKITKSQDPESWYFEKVGSEFEVEEYNEEYFKALNVKSYFKPYNKKKKIAWVNPAFTFLIKKTDCEEI